MAVVGDTIDIVTLSAGGYHTCALFSAGNLKCWGYNFDGQVGNTGGGQFITSPIDVLRFTLGAAEIALGSYHTCAHAPKGGARCWGYNIYGQVGDGTGLDRASPAFVSGLESGVADLSAGGYHSCALLSDGGLKCWGSNSSGQLGDGSTTPRAVPNSVTGLESGVSAVKAGYSHTCAIVGGAVKCWGWNGNGQLGDGTTVNRSLPTQVTGLSAGVAAIATGSYHTCALLTGGAAKCWGSNSSGQLGDGSTAQRTTPVDVAGLSVGVLAITAGAYHSCALLSDGSVRCWGSNGSGQLGDGTLATRITPVTVTGIPGGAFSISAGNAHTCAVSSANSGAKCWGYNVTGQLGNGTTADSATPVDVSGLTSGVAAIAAGNYHTCARISSGSLKCWGYNFYGQVGDGSTIQRSTGVEILPSQSITFSPPVQLFVGSPLPLSATATSGQLVTYDTWTPTICSLSNATVTATVVGWCGLRVSQGGNGTFAPAPQQLRLVQVGPGGQTISFDAISDKVLGDPPFNPSAVSSSGLPVQFMSTTTAVCTVTGSTVTLVANGTCTITADQSGNSNYNPAPQVSRSFQVLPPVDLTVGKNGTGFGTVTSIAPASPSINCGTTCSASYPQGTLVSLMAAPASGSIFAGWSGGGCSGTGGCTVTMTATTVVTATFNLATMRYSDANGDGRSDVFWRDTTGGLVYQWQMNGLSVSGQGYMPSVTPAWSIAGIGDLSGDGKADIFWREPVAGLNYLWILDGLAITFQGYLPSVPSPWTVVGVGDASGDAKADVFWRNPSTGQNYLWVMNAISITNQGYLPTVAGADWKVAGVADYSGDAKADVLWRNEATGQNFLWVMNGLAVSSQGYLPSVGGIDWEIVASPDTNGDGRADVLWRNNVTGQNYLWLMNGLALSAQGYLPTVADANWKVVGYGDYNGDGKGDVLWRKATTGQSYLWTMDALTVSTQGYLPSVAGSNWQPVK